MLMDISLTWFLRWINSHCELMIYVPIGKISSLLVASPPGKQETPIYTSFHGQDLSILRLFPEISQPVQAVRLGHRGTSKVMLHLTFLTTACNLFRPTRSAAISSFNAWSVLIYKLVSFFARRK
jgi:hypothetical protein